jgi:hypothetical protein
MRSQCATRQPNPTVIKQRGMDFAYLGQLARSQIQGMDLAAIHQQFPRERQPEGRDRTNLPALLDDKISILEAGPTVNVHECSYHHS